MNHQSPSTTINTSREGKSNPINSIEKVPFDAVLASRRIDDIGYYMNDDGYLNKIGKIVKAAYPELADWNPQPAAEAYIHCKKVLGLNSEFGGRDEKVLTTLRKIFTTPV